MENTVSQQGQAQPEKTGLERLEEAYNAGETTEVKTETKTEEPGLVDQEAKTEGLTEGKTEGKTEAKQEAKVEAKTETKEEKPFEFQDQTREPEEGSWENLIKGYGFELPQDYSEEKGEEVLKQLFEKRAEEREQKALALTEADLISKYPEKLQGQAKMYLDLMKAGKTMEEVMAPLAEVRELKSLEKEALVRWAVSQTPGYTEEMVNTDMERLSNGNLIDIEYKKVLLKLDNYEKQFIQEQQKQLELYNTQAAQLQEQRKQKEFDDFKKALDGEKAFMDIKLKDSNKAQLISKYQQGYKEQLLNDPKKLARFMLFDAYGEQAMKYVLDRAKEQALLAEVKKKHNIPQNVVSAGGSRSTTENNYESGLAKLEAEWKQGQGQ